MRNVYQKQHNLIGHGLHRNRKKRRQRQVQMLHTNPSTQRGRLENSLLLIGT